MSSSYRNTMGKFTDVDRPPSDTPSDISFSSTHDLFAVSSWDSSLYFYNYNTQPYTLRSKIQLPSPLLSTCFIDKLCLTGSGDGTLHAIDIETGGSTPMKYHDMGIKSIKQIAPNVFITGSWDKKIKISDIRSPNQPTIIDLPERLYALDVHPNFFVCTTAGNKILKYDFNNMNTYKTIPTKLSYQIRSLAILNDDSLVVGGSDGKGEHISFNMSDKNYVFKIHRTINVAFPIHCVKKHLNSNDCFVTGGGDGTVQVLNAITRHKLQTDDVKSPVVCMGFSDDGRSFVVCTGNDWTQGYNTSNNDQVNVKVLKFNN